MGTRRIWQDRRDRIRLAVSESLTYQENVWS